MKIQVEDLRPNPYRRMDKGYPIDKAKVESLKRSISDTSFWDNLLARKNGDGYQIAYGHHRLIAIQELGIEEVNIPVRDLDDRTMLKIMANENMEQWTQNVGVINETVAAVKEFLETDSGTTPSVTSLQDRICNFLGPEWKPFTIQSALATLAADEVTEEEEKESEVAVAVAFEEAKKTKTKPKRKKVVRAISRKAVETFTLPAHADLIRQLLTSPLYGGLLSKKEQDKFIKQMYREMVRDETEITTPNIKEKFLDAILQRFGSEVEARKEEAALIKKATEAAKSTFEKMATKSCKEWDKVFLAIAKVKIKRKELDDGGAAKVEKIIAGIERTIASWRRN